MIDISSETGFRATFREAFSPKIEVRLLEIDDTDVAIGR